MGQAARTTARRPGENWVVSLRRGNVLFLKNASKIKPAGKERDMPSPATIREQRLRKTKAQLIDEIDTLEQRAAAIEAASRRGAPVPAKASDRYLANQELADLAKFPSENPNPVLRVMPDGAALYANDAAIAVKGLLKGCESRMAVMSAAWFVEFRQRLPWLLHVD